MRKKLPRNVIVGIIGFDVTKAQIWGPIATWQMRGLENVVVERDFNSPDGWLFAMAVREKDAELLKKLNKAVRSLSKSKTTARLMTAYDNSKRSLE